MTNAPTYRLLLACPDRPGVIAHVSGFVRDLGGNILDADQHADPNTGRFFMRVAVDSAGFEPGDDAFGTRWDAMLANLGFGPDEVEWRLHDGRRRRRMAVLAGPSTHCAQDLLWRVETGDLDAEVAVVVSNHETVRPLAALLGVPFVHLPVSTSKAVPDQANRDKAAQEARVLEAVEGADLVVLARYMQILSPDFVGRYAGRLINIHHSFLPAFAGAKPYHQAFERGVKIIGATSHYVTSELDQGPIIAQGTAPVSHRDTVEDLVRKGKDLERVVLAEAVRLHLDDRVIVHANKTVVFD